MRISVALLEKDDVYVNRLLKGIQSAYAKKLSIKAFSDEQNFLDELNSQFYDMALVAQENAG